MLIYKYYIIIIVLLELKEESIELDEVEQRKGLRYFKELGRIICC